MPGNRVTRPRANFLSPAWLFSLEASAGVEARAEPATSFMVQTPTSMHPASNIDLGPEYRPHRFVGRLETWISERFKNIAGPRQFDRDIGQNPRRALAQDHNTVSQQHRFGDVVG